MATKSKYQYQYFAILILLYVAFVTVGFPAQILGVAWDSMMVDFQKPFTSGGLLLSLIAILSSAGSFAVGYFIKKIHISKIVMFSSILMALGMFGYTITTSWIFLLAFTIPMGFGSGVMNAGVNSYVAEHYSSRYMNWLHGFWGLGSTIAPAIMTFTIHSYQSWRLGYIYIAIIQATIIAIYILTLRIWKEKKKKARIAKVINKKNTDNKPNNILSFAPICGILIFFLYAAVETNIGMWSFPLLTKKLGVSDAFAGTMVVIYWGSLTAGRFAMGVISNKVGNRKIINYGMIGAFIGLLLMISDNPYIMVPCMILTGLSLSGLVPAMMHETQFRYHSAISPLMTSFQIGSTTLGVAVSSPLMGNIVDNNMTLLFPILAIIMAIILILNRILNKLT